jgi:hypothetical protein
MSTLAENENVYDLTPTQQAMLLYALYAPESQAYFEQVTYSHHGPLNISAFISAWQRVVDPNANQPTTLCWDKGCLI